MDRIFKKTHLGPGPIEVLLTWFVCPHLRSVWSGLGYGKKSGNFHIYCLLSSARRLIFQLNITELEENTIKKII